MATAEQIRAEREAARLQRDAERNARRDQSRADIAAREAQQKAEMQAIMEAERKRQDELNGPYMDAYGRVDQAAIDALKADWMSKNLGSSLMSDGKYDQFADPGSLFVNMMTGEVTPNRLLAATNPGIINATPPRVSYSGSAANPLSLPTASGQYNLYSRGEDGGRDLYVDTGNGQLFYAGDERYTPASTGGDDPRGMYASGYRNLEENYQPFNSYSDAKSVYSKGFVPWNIDNVYEGLSNRQAFNLNALWGGTQYAQGRVTDWSHLDPTQYKANVIASDTRNRLWNEYDRLTAQGSRPAKNPDEVALDFYVKNVGQNGNQFGYGPGVNTALLSEAITTQFLNSPDVVQARGISYKTPQWKMAEIDAFGTAHEAGVPIWQVFERQGISSGGFGRFIPLIIGAIVFPGMGAALANALGGTIAANIAAGAIIGGVNAEINGGNFIDGAVKSALTAGTGAAIANIGIAAEVSSAIESVGIDANIANSVADTAERAITSAIVAEATGGDVSDAILNTLVAAGVSAARGEIADIADNLIAGEAPADIEDAEIGAAMTEAAIQPQETSIVAPQQQEVVASPAPQPEIVASQPIPAGPITPEEIISEIRPEPVTPEPIVTEEAVVPRETEVAVPEIVAETTPESVIPAPVEPAPDASVQDEIPIEAAPVEDVVEPEPVKPQQPEPFPPITEDDLLQALIDEEIIPEEAAVETESIFEAPEIAPEAPGEGQPAEKIPAKEVVVEPVVEEVPIFEEPLPIPEAMPEVEPEPVLPEEGQLEEEAAPADEVAPEDEPMPEEPDIGDQEVLDALSEEDTGEDVAPEEGAGEEVAPEEKEVLPTEEPTEETPEEEPGVERQRTESPSSLDKLIASLLLSEQGGQGARVSVPRRSVTQESVSPREISGSVTGIIGKKQPMFSSDEDEQSAEWNRRSLRLRKVLGL